MPQAPGPTWVPSTPVARVTKQSRGWYSSTSAARIRSATSGASAWATPKRSTVRARGETPIQQRQHPGPPRSPGPAPARSARPGPRRRGTGSASRPACRPSHALPRETRPERSRLSYRSTVSSMPDWPRTRVQLRRDPLARSTPIPPARPRGAPAVPTPERGRAAVHQVDPVDAGRRGWPPGPTRRCPTGWTRAAPPPPRRLPPGHPERPE